MKIAILTSLLFQECSEITGKDRIIWGGAEVYLYQLCKLFQSMNHEVDVYQSLPQTTIIDGKRAKVQSGNIKKDFRGIPVICLSGTEDYWTQSTNPRLNMIFNEVAIHYDLVIFFATFLCYPFVPNNSISISHGIFWDYHAHYIANARPEDKAEFMRKQLFGFTEPDVCVAVDSNVRKVIAAIQPGAERKINIIYNFVDTEAFTPAKEKTWEGINVLYPRRLTILRGCNDLIKASQQYPDYQYLAVGQAGDERIEQFTSAWGNTKKNIKFIWKPMEEMPEVYQQADISVVPTRACEGLSLSLLESMSCGLPVVTTPVGGLGDAVIPNYNALIYDPHYGGLGECIDFLAKNEDVRQVMGERNREIAKQCFDISLWRERWRRLIQGFGG
jgi:glycosyltransferase involved in cell wall biosynthesis